MIIEIPSHTDMYLALAMMRARVGAGSCAIHLRPKVRCAIAIKLNPT
jgi:hypothetical protein